jgi:hypothetical protein
VSRPTPLHAPKSLGRVRPTIRPALLRCAQSQGLLAREVEREPRTFEPEILHELEELGLVHLVVKKKSRIWRATEEGKALVTAHVPKLLHRRSELGYTSSPVQAVWGEPEAMDARAA